MGRLFRAWTLSALGVRSDSQVWYLLRKRFGGIPWLADKEGKKAAAVRGNPTASNCLAEGTQALGWAGTARGSPMARGRGIIKQAGVTY